MVDALVLQDWGLIDESNSAELRNDLPMVRGGRTEYSLLNSTLDAMLDTKAIATKNQVRVPGLTKLLDMYFQTVAQGKHVRTQSFWKRMIWKAGDWHGSQDEFKENCKAVWDLAHHTSSIVHRYADESKAGIARVSIRRRRSLDELVDQAGPDLVQRHNQHGDTATTRRSTPPNTGVVAQSSSITTNTLSEETIRNIAEMRAPKTVKQLIYRRLSGRISQIVNRFHARNVGPSRGAAPTVNVGGKNNRGTAINTHPTEVEWNGADDFDGISDNGSL
ncbi:uncharacterized protein F5147DRAFT_709217 [Suillus discolor]|uniref:Uncharacterized protein n=1 Tax=Suillus discolor TaxID=1912936 RepID=A0A9P7F2I5_9AGAM|nr:uncharacterized protein F5147DRAFT_709217 [Suillus discolor]KAG2101346.1 hypothetical protein F5147DRAFT_709217 [Suillus discolor]